ncbi:cellulase-like family protein [Nonomuraea sp. NPDC050153]|uniref:cellulase-like family protein n=1 Tax=Nonomuraea sp. NPDC050153 TaxID=3364359 RepID=UPI0037A4BDAF
MSELTISLWDFTWYTRTGPGEPFEDLDRAFADAVARGYNTVRICAMPYLLFGSGLDTSALTFAPFGRGYGLRTRWYDVRESATIDGRAHLLALFQAARRHGCRVIVSSWEYQQSSSFLSDPAWYEALRAVPADRRAHALARALADLVDFVAGHGLAERIAFVELHNEIQSTWLTEALAPGEPRVLGLRPYLERAVDTFKERHPDTPVTVNYARVPHAEMRGIPGNVDVAVFHPYVYGVLDELIETFALRDTSVPFPQERARRELLRPDAPDLEDWRPEQAWRSAATVVPAREVYLHDWCDPARFDRWLYDRYAVYRYGMAERLRLWIEVAADWAAARGLPLVFGEGWVGYTPLHGTFEEGTVGAEICLQAVAHARRVDAWGTVVCSNAAPQHPMWADVELQRRANALFTGGR